MNSLIKKLEQAEAGSRELDWLIHKHIGVDKRPMWASFWLHYTTSFDAALTLVPEGRGIMLRTNTSSPQAIVYCPVGTRLGNHYGEASTPALALCIAALKACVSSNIER